METRTQPREPSPAEAEVDRLGALLMLPPKDLEARGAELVSFLELGSPSSLTPHAARLLELLENAHFRRATSTEMTAREAIVRAVMRLGYPWALQLSPEDVGLSRLEEKRQQRQRSSRFRRLLMVAGVIGLGVAVGVALTRETPSGPGDVLLESERVYTIPPIDKVVPASSRAELLADSMKALAEEDQHAAAFSIGFDCLADPELKPSTCLRAMAKVMESKGRDPDLAAEYRVNVEASLFDLMWEQKDRSHPPFNTLKMLKELRRVWLVPDAALPTDEELKKAGRLASFASVSLERGFLDSAVLQAEACVSQFPDSVGCHLVLYKAHSAFASQVPFEQMKPHGDAMEHHRKELARIVSHAKRLACERGEVPRPRPIGCPDSFPY